MKIDNELLTKLEKLSKLNIDDDKREDIMNDLTNIVDFVENLNELNLEEEDSLYQSTKETSKLRTDTPSQNLKIVDEILKNSPLRDGRSFIVPKIIE